jgi:hypothetical protein
MDKIKTYKELRVYQAAIDAAMRVFEITKRFPPEERFAMVDQIRRSSRSVCSNIGEAWPNADMLLISPASSAIQRLRPRKRAFGWIWRFVASTFLSRKQANSMSPMIEYLVNWSA